MKCIAKKAKQFKKVFNKYINGTKGIISIFLSLVMLPFASTALIIVESARYQNAMELVDEMLDCIGLSSIADYDSYLESRFGLLAMSQETTPQQKYTKYLDANLPALNNSFSYTSASAVGVYPLSDEGVLKSQLLEYSEVTVLTEALYNGLEIDKLFDKLYEMLGLEDINKMAEATTAVANVASSTADLVDAAVEAVAYYSTYKTQKSEYNTAADSFHNKSKDLISKLNTAKGNLTEDDELKDIYKDDDVKTAVKDCEEARNTFKKEAGEMSDAVETMRGHLVKLSDTANSITTNASKAQTAIDKANQAGTKAESSATSTDWILSKANDITTVLDATLTATWFDDMMNQYRALDLQKELLGKVVCDKTDDGNSSKYYIDVYSTETQIKNDLPKISTGSVKSEFVALSSVIAEMNNEESKAIDDEQSVGLGKLIDVAGELLNISLLYNGSLDSHVSPSAFHNYNPKGLSFTNKAMISSLRAIVQSGKDLVDSFTELNILKALKAIAEFLYGVGAFLVSIVSWVVETCVNLVKLIASGSEMYDTFLLSAYSVYNMPCRTTYKDGKSLTGFGYSSIFDKMGGVYNNRATGMLDDLLTMIDQQGTGNDPGFKGAESEYILVGNANELLNQSATFFNIFMLRMVLNLIPIFTNDEVKVMVGAANVAGWVVYLALIIAEPLIDTLMLVNGQSIHMVKTYNHITPTGLVILAKTLPGMTGLSDYSKKKIGEVMKKKHDPKGEIKATGWLDVDLNYQENVLLLLLLTTEQSEIMARIADLIQMESAVYHKDTCQFDLDNAHTFVKAKVDGTLNSMFDMEALTKNGPFNISRTRLIGY